MRLDGLAYEHFKLAVDGGKQHCLRENARARAGGRPSQPVRECGCNILTAETGEKGTLVRSRSAPFLTARDKADVCLCQHLCICRGEAALRRRARGFPYLRDPVVAVPFHQRAIEGRAQPVPPAWLRLSYGSPDCAVDMRHVSWRKRAYHARGLVQGIAIRPALRHRSAEFRDSCHAFVA